MSLAICSVGMDEGERGKRGGGLGGWVKWGGTDKEMVDWLVSW